MVAIKKSVPITLEMKFSSNSRRLLTQALLLFSKKFQDRPEPLHEQAFVFAVSLQLSSCDINYKCRLVKICCYTQ